MLASVIGAFYYLRIIKLMYVDEPVTGQPLAVWQPGVRLAVGLNGVMVLVLGVLPGQLLALCSRVLVG